MMDRAFQKFISGEQEAFRHMYDKYVNMLRYLAMKYIDDRMVADDILQETFTSLWEKRTSIANEPAMKSFLYVGVRNRSLNHLRHNKVRTKYISGGFHEEDTGDFLEKVIETEFMDMLFKVYEELPPACKEVYRLNLEGKKNEEIAAMLNISVNTVKKYKVNANHYMRGRVKDLIILLLTLSWYFYKK